MILLSKKNPPPLPKKETFFTKPDDSIETINLLATNDLHGALLAHANKKIFTPSNATILASHIKNLRSKDAAHFLWLDAGDHLYGSQESEALHGEPMIEFFNRLGLSAAVLGNHEFDQGIFQLRHTIAPAKFQYVVSNLHSKSGKTSDFWAPYTIKQVGKVRVGIVGLLTHDSFRYAPKEFSEHFTLGNLTQSMIETAATLRQRGAQVIVVVAHAGVQCPVSNVIRNCKGELFNALLQLPPNTIDAVISGHTHRSASGFLNLKGQRLPIVQASPYFQEAHVLLVPFSTKNRRVVQEKIVIQPAIDLQNSSVVADEETAQWLQPLLQKDRIIGQLPLDLGLSYHEPSALPLEFAKLLKEYSHSDIFLFPSGILRNSLNQGSLYESTLFRSFPFPNDIVQSKILGVELKRAIKNIKGQGFVRYSYWAVTPLMIEDDKFYQVGTLRTTLGYQISPFDYLSKEVLPTASWNSLGNAQVALKEQIRKVYPMLVGSLR